MLRLIEFWNKEDKLTLTEINNYLATWPNLATSSDETNTIAPIVGAKNKSKWKSICTRNETNWN